MFQKILVANRGEIAVRIIRACKEMGISTVAIYSKADKDSLHTKLADESICVGEADVKSSYLNIPAILSAAEITGAQAIHPGYGLLSENAEFAQICKECNIEFIGPSSQNILDMGDKDKARKTMLNIGVNVAKGSDVIENEEQLVEEAKKIGYPLMIKAVAGGGGKGIRVVDDEKELLNAYNIVTGEAINSFKNGNVYLETYIQNARHIEVQVLVDKFGNVVCLEDRECSIQANNQKLVEEAPANISIDIKANMRKTAIDIVKSIGYTNAGTIEFLMDTSGDFYFLEMNTRLQVEHTVTEMITGIDIVKWQIRIAAGVKLNFDEKQFEYCNSHAIECRINAKNTGKVRILHLPSGFGVRCDTDLYQGMSIVPYYDSMICKVISCATTRDEAIRKLKTALCETIIHGIKTNIDNQLTILDDEKFEKGTYDINFMKDIKQ